MSPASGPVLASLPTVEIAHPAVRGVAGPALPLETWPGGMGPPVIVVDPGDGGEVAPLLDGPLRRSRHPIAVLIPPEHRDRFEQHRERWITLLSAVEPARLRIAFDADPDRALDAAFADHPPARLHGATLLNRSPALSPELRARYDQAFARRHQREMGAIQRSMATWRSARLAPTPRSIFGAADRSTSALRFLGAELTASARRLGLRAEFLEIDSLNDPFRPLRRLEALLAAQPDLLVSFVASRHRDWGRIAEGVPTLSYWSSDPSRYDLPSMGFGADDLVCISNPRWRTHFAALGVEALHLPLASGLADALHPLPSEIDEERCRDVLVVGNLPEARDVLPSSLHAFLPDIEAAAAADDADAIEALTAGAPADEAAAIRRSIEFAQTRDQRIRAAIALATARIPLRVHGCARWREALRHTPAEGAWRGPLVDRAASAAAFRSALAVVNVVSRNNLEGLNMRVFDVAACGGIVASTETPALHAAFAVPSEALAFASPEELPAILAALAADPARRRAIRAAALDRVRRDHTWECRWRQVFAWLAERTTARRPA